MKRTLAGLLSRNELIELLGWLRVRGPVRRTYCRWFGPEGGILSLELGGQRGRFYVHSELAATNLKSFGGERHLLELLMRMLRPGDVVFDIGAENGLYSVFLARQVKEEGRVIAFEPQGNGYERLQDNLALNGLRNVRAFRLALGEHSYEGRLRPAQAGAAPRIAEAGNTGVLHRIQVVEGDRLVEMEKLPLPRAVKIDVEGHEYAVLRGLKRTLSNPTCEIVCCEVHPRLLPEGVGPDNVLELLKSYGFNRFDAFTRAAEQHVVARKEQSTPTDRGSDQGTTVSNKA